MEKLVELKNISKGYTNKTILNKISLSLNRKQIYAILGGNGTGKSTLLRLIAGIESPSSGEIHYSNHIKIGYVPERFPKGIRFTPSEYLQYMGKMSGTSTKTLTKRIGDLLHRFKMDELKNQRIMDLSKGNIQKVGIIQAVLMNPNLVILDEPLSGLDTAAQEELVKILVELKQEGSTILLTYHESHIFESLVDNTFYLHNGKISSVKPLERKSIKLLVVRNIDKSLVHTWDEIIQLEEKDNQLFIYVSVNESDATISRVLQHNGSIEAVSTVSEHHEMGGML